MLRTNQRELFHACFPGYLEPRSEFQAARGRFGTELPRVYQ